ncbi:MAG TPA: glycosyltransferase 61 family protein [Nocardioides sp.]|uniref:glycosyltransferase family 61 protein n=1 Tax=Nocardioides sp. TaxID=35761 RepID=UPI002F3EDA9A
MPPRPPGDPAIPDLRALGSIVPKGASGRRVAVLVAHGGVRDRLEAWLSELADDRVLVLTPEPADLPGYDVPVRAARALTEVTDHLRRSGAVDLVVDLLATDRLPEGCPDHRSLLAAVLPHLTRHGLFVHDRVAAPGDLGGGFGGLAGVLDDSADAALGDSVRAVMLTHEPMVVSKRYRHYLLLREIDVPEVLVAREPALSVDELAALPEGRVDSRTTVHHHGAAPTIAPMKDVLHHPRLVTRHYRGPVAMSGRTLMWSGSTVLPDSFRWHLADDLGNPHLVDPAGEFARLKRRLVPERSLDGDFYQLESAYPSHFGHVLTEVVSRMWGWDEARRRLPGLKLLFHPRRDFDPEVERAVFSAFGIADDDVVGADGPVLVGSVVSATPMWHNAEPHYVHPGIAEVWERIGAGLRPHESDVVTSPRIFVSRSDATANNDRICRNLRQVERRFADRGFTILYPEQHPLPDQARLFREARVVAGFGGSALFNVMHTRRLEALVVLNHSGYFARNEHLFAAVKGGESHYFWSPPDRSPANPRSKQALRAGWEFDLPGLGDDLDRLITRL